MLASENKISSHTAEDIEGESVNKSQQYHQIVTDVRAILSGETDMIANMANISAILFNNLQNVNWAGFYLFKDSQLVLGPFQGMPACIRIPIGKGVCGTAASTMESQLVENVHEFSGHIACDTASNSEIVIPVIHSGQLIAVLDLDSPAFSRFDGTDLRYLSEVVDILIDTLIA